MPPVTSILCVCLGNICRSPTAQSVLETALSGRGIRVDSAGTGDWHVGKPPYGPMQTAALSRGFDLSAQRARQVETRDFETFDLILAMDRENLADLERMRPPGARAQVLLFTSVLPEGPHDVPDPYFTRDFDGALDLIERAGAAWATQPHMSSAT